MRYIVMHKSDAKMEAAQPPSKEIIRKMGALVQGSLASGVFLNGAGLHRSATRVRLEYKKGERKITKGPYTGKNELVGSMAMLRTRDLDEAIEHTDRFAAALGDVEIEIGPVVEPWDIGVMPKPEGVLPARFLLLIKSEPGQEHPSAHRENLAELTAELRKREVLLLFEVLAPSARGARLASGSSRRWTDGPFAESKELIAGFSLLELPNRDAVIEWANRYADILEGNEVDLRELD